MSSDVELLGQIDTSDKTMAVPPGSGLLIGPIKQRLIAAGWKLVVTPGNMRITGTFGPETNLRVAGTVHARYGLVIRQRQVDYCVPIGGPAVSYDLSIMDLHSGEEVLTQSGRDCRDFAVEKFMNAINGGKAS